MDSVIRSEKQKLASHVFVSQVDKDERIDTATDESHFYFGLLISLASVVGFFYGNIYVQRYRYPLLFAWYEHVKNAKVKGKPAPGIESAAPYGMEQVCVARDFPPVQTVMTIGLWKNLSPMAADFLLTTVAYFQNDPYVSSGGPATRDKLTSVHWSGGFEQWTPPATAEDIVGKDGFLCGGMSGDEETVKQTIIKKWIWSKHGPNKDKKTRWNIWYDFLPDPQLSEESFLQTPCIAALYAGSKKDEGSSADPCTSYAKSESNLYQLFAGGLCYVAKQNQSVAMSPGQLFRTFFGTGYQHSSTCEGDLAMGAVSGATGIGMMALGFMPFLGPELTVIALAMGGGAGAAAGAIKSKQKCRPADKGGAEKGGGVMS